MNTVANKLTRLILFPSVALMAGLFFSACDEKSTPQPGGLTREHARKLMLEFKEEGKKREDRLASLKEHLERGEVVYLGAGEYDVRRDARDNPDLPPGQADVLVSQTQALNEQRKNLLKAIGEASGKQPAILAAAMVRMGGNDMAGEVLPEGKDLGENEYVIARVGVSWFADENLQHKLPERLPGFRVLTVLSRRGQALRVQHKNTVGWVREHDVIAWKQFLCLKFPNPKKEAKRDRSRTVFFDDVKRLEHYASFPSRASLDAAISDLYRLVDEGGHARELSEKGIVALEPHGWNDKAIYPILEHRPLYIKNNGRALKLAAMTAPSPGAQDGPSPEAVKKAIAEKGMPVDVVFVIDLTNSMNKSIEIVRKEVARMVARYDQPGLDAKFTLWGFRDDPSLCSGFEFTSKNFTRRELVPLKQFKEVLKNVKAAKASDADFYEDVLKGVSDAALLTHWRDHSLRFMHLIGDAPGREGLNESDPTCKASNKPRGTAGKDQADGTAWTFETLGKYLVDNKIYIFPIYLTYPDWAKYRAVGESQFAALAHGSGRYAVVEGTSPFSSQIGDLSRLNESLLSNYAALKMEALEKGRIDQPKAFQDKGEEMAHGLFSAAFVDWVANHVQTEEAPSDLEGWVYSYDLKNDGLNAVEPSVLLTRRQLNDLYQLLLKYNRALAFGRFQSEEASEGTFYDALLKTSVLSNKDPNQLSGDDRLTSESKVKELLESLPFKSSLMQQDRDTSLADGRWQRRMAVRLQGILQYIRQVYANDSLWRALDSHDDSADKVIMYPLEMLP